MGDSRTIQQLDEGQVVAVRGSEAPAYVIGIGEKDVAAAGTSEAPSATTSPCRSVLIMAKTTNTGSVYVGISGACSSTRYMAVLSAGQTMEFSVNDVASLHIDVGTSGDGVYWYSFN